MAITRAEEHRLRSAIRGALLGTLVGDAVGAPFEGARPTTIAKAADRRRRALAEAPLPYTDDTQMMLALARHLVDAPEVDVARLVTAFKDEFEPWRGYGGGMHRIHDAWERGVPLAEAARAAFEDGSLGNGGAMRVAPVGACWSHDDERLAEVAARSAAPTHVHPVGEDGAVVQALAVGRAAAQESFEPSDLDALAAAAATHELTAGLAEAAELARNWPPALGEPTRAAADRLGNAVEAHRSVPTACWIAATTTDPDDALHYALAIGGDVDTIGAMAVAVRGAAEGADAFDPDLLRHCEGAADVRAAADRLTDTALALRPG